VDAKEALQDGFDFRPANSGVAVLVDDRALDRDQRAVAVGRDCSSFQHQRGHVAWNVEPCGEVPAERVLLVVGPLASTPDVEAEVDRG
jgi:hypothetical protein